ncbi:putative dihydrodipicolinate synthase protein [Neofusicoccum parvum]|uniref:Dihydrodipicolinate synthase protein n=1 Tax=Neofusicoccum parvum TaxID=310453 RepID=A0ACB5S8M6_9PEZI|nr:putative dihydrodipicolinate synthase protein [Neofusicoccum parvum]
MAAHKELTGILTALITPFTPDGSAIDAAALDAHINQQIAAGIHGLVPGGSTGEFTTLSTAERKQLLEICVASSRGRVPVVAGIGALSTAEALDLAAHARAAGAAALMVVPPFYDALSLPLLKAYFTEISAAAEGLPIMYYNIPAASGVNLSPEEIASLSEVGVKYLKDTSGNAPALTELLFGLHDRITAFNGWDTLTFYGLAAGAKGSVWGAANVIPELCVELWDAVAMKGDLKKGRELWSRIWPQSYGRIRVDK